VAREERRAVQESRLVTRKLRSPSGHIVALDLTGHGRSFPGWARNWIDYRASRARIDRRVDAGELPERCGVCYCEVDITPAPHSPRCTA
jgi:pimeloyl-ACP methyl ester carboxylesterase